MKIKHNTPDLLIAEDMPWFIAIMLFIFIMAFVTPGVLMAFDGVPAGLLFAVAGGGMGFAGMAIFVERLQVILDATANTATIRSRTILRYRETVFPLTDVRYATGHTTLSGGESDRSRPRRQVHRPSLVISDGAGEDDILHPVTEVYSSGGGTARLVRAVNTWLEQNRT